MLGDTALMLGVNPIGIARTSAIFLRVKIFLSSLLQWSFGHPFCATLVVSCAHIVETELVLKQIPSPKSQRIQESSLRICKPPAMLHPNADVWEFIPSFSQVEENRS